MAENNQINVSTVTSSSRLMENLLKGNMPMPFSRDIFLMNTMINFLVNDESIEGIRELKREEKLKLLLETKEINGTKEIIVLDSKGRKLGAIPRAKNEVLYNLMDAGKALFAVVKDGSFGEAFEEDSLIDVFIDVFMCD